MNAITQRNGSNGQLQRIPRGVILDVSGEPLNAFGLAREALATGYSNYGANLTKNSLVGWLHHGGDADRDIGWNLKVLRERSRDAFMGIPLAAAAIETLDTTVIGEGLFPAPNVDGEVLGLDDQQTADLNRELALKFGWWANDSRECDYEAKDSFYIKQSVAFKSMLLSGDCPVLFPLKPRPDTLFDFRLRILEADRIMNPPVLQPTPTINIFTGVELDETGELVAYHIANRHPLSAFTSGVLPITFLEPIQTTRVTPFGAKTGRRNMVLLIKPERPEQRRGVPLLASCLELLKQHGRYIDSTVVAAVIQSYFTAFITSEFPDANLFDTMLTQEQKDEIWNFNPYNVQLGPGIVNFMRPGHAVNFANPTQPMASFGEFTISVAKFIGAAVGIPHEVLLKQFNASYSASRAALLDFWKRVRKWRSQMVDQFCQPAYEEWLIDAISLGRIELFKGGFDDPMIRRAMLRCIWTGASAGSLDPVKEVTAADLKVKCGFSTTEREAIEMNGSNYRDNVTQQSVELGEFNDAELIFPPYRPTISSTPFSAKTPEAPAPPAPGTRPPPFQKGRAVARRLYISNNRAVLAGGLSGRFER